MLLLERLQLVEEPVVLRVGDLGVVEDVVAVEVVVELLAQLFGALCRRSWSPSSVMLASPAQSTRDPAGVARSHIRASAKVVFLQTPSHNIGCSYSSAPAYLRCDIRSGLKPPRGSRRAARTTGRSATRLARPVVRKGVRRGHGALPKRQGHPLRNDLARRAFRLQIQPFRPALQKPQRPRLLPQPPALVPLLTRALQPRYQVVTQRSAVDGVATSVAAEGPREGGPVTHMTVLSVDLTVTDTVGQDLLRTPTNRSIAEWLSMVPAGRLRTSVRGTRGQKWIARRIRSRAATPAVAPILHIGSPYEKVIRPLFASQYSTRSR